MDGKLIIEVYEYAQDASMPVFEYIPCELSKCLKGKSTKLKDIIQRGFSDLPKKAQDSGKRQEILQKVEDASIGNIDVVFHPAKGNEDARVELTNLIPVTMTYADARRIKEEEGDIILQGRYRLSTGNEVTSLKDGQRLTLMYSNDQQLDEMEDEEGQKEIRLNITYLQEA